MKDDRLDNLQILRFVAASLVLTTHITFYLHERIDETVEIWHQGEAGVAIFFLISGAVMYMSLSRGRTQQTSAGFFLKKRIARIFPLYWSITAAKIIIGLLIPTVVLHNKPDFIHAVGSFFLIPMFNSAGDVQPIHGVGWTLLHEMFFYYMLALGLSISRTPVVFATLILCLLVGSTFIYSPDFAIAKVYGSEINLLFVTGMGLAAVFVNGYRMPVAIAIPLLLIGIIGLTSQSFREVRIAALGRFDIAAVAIVASIMYLGFPLSRTLKGALLKLGDSSYSLYLVHPIFAPAACIFLVKLGLQSAYLISIVAFAASVTAGHLVFLLIEQPLHRRARIMLRVKVPEDRGSARDAARRPSRHIQVTRT